MSSVRIKAFDTAIEFTDTLTKNGSPVDLQGATVKFIVKGSGSAYVADAILVDAEAGKVKYEVVAGFPTKAGAYNQEWEVTFADTSKLTFPSTGYNKIIIIDDLNKA